MFNLEEIMGFNTTTLPNRTVLYVPLKLRERLSEHWTRLLKAAGGMTATKAVGAWIDGDGNVVEEEVLTVTLFSGGDWRAEHDFDSVLRQWVQAVLDLGEQAVLVERNGGAYLYEAIAP